MTPWIVLTLTAFFGLFIGSFLATLVLRLPKGEPVALARSACASCGRKLGPLELVPIASWLVQAGRCRGCRAPVSVFYPLMEIATAALALWAGFVAGGAALIFSCALGWILLTLALIDVRVFRLPDVLTLPLAVLGLVAAWMLAPEHFLAHVLGAIAGFAVFALVALAYRYVRGRSGLGLGDAKLLAAAGAWVGIAGLPSVVLIASVTALLVVLGARIARRPLRADSAIPFGAFLAVGTWMVWLYAPLLP
jgi:leader peptidase (prepilin peptidase)/N-methyltransferase